MKENIQNKHVYHNKNNDYAWGAFLMFLGVTLLFNSLNILPWDAWGFILRFWPIFIIIAGLGIIFDSSKYFRWILGIAALAIYSLIMIIVLNRYNDTYWQELNFDVPDWIDRIEERFEEPNVGEMIEDTFTLSPQFAKYTNYDMNIDVDTSMFSLMEGSGVDRFEIESRYYENWGKPIVLLHEAEDTLTIDFEQSKMDWPRVSIPHRGPSYDFFLGKNLLVESLDVNLGAGKGVIYLETTDLEMMKADVGAGSLEITLEEVPDESEYSLNVGAGEIVLEIPDDINYELSYSLGIGNLSVNGQDVSKVTGDGRVKFDQGSSGDMVYIEVDVGVGSFELNTIKFSSSDNV